MAKPQPHWWETGPDMDPNAAVVAELAASAQAAQQLGEEVGAQMIAWAAEHQPCPVCGRLVVDHTRRELRRCDDTRPDLTLLTG